MDPSFTHLSFIIIFLKFRSLILDHQLRFTANELKDIIDVLFLIYFEFFEKFSLLVPGVRP